MLVLLAPRTCHAVSSSRSPATVAAGLAASASSGARIAPLAGQVSKPLYPPYALFPFCSNGTQYVPGTNELWFWEMCPGMVSLTDKQVTKNVPACAPEQATVKLWETGAGKGQSSVLLSFATCAGGAEGSPPTWFGWQPDPLGAAPLPTTSAVTEVSVGVVPGAYTHGGCSSTAVTSYSQNWTPSTGSGLGGGSYTSPILHHSLLKNLTAGVKCVFFPTFSYVFCALFLVPFFSLHSFSLPLSPFFFPLSLSLSPSPFFPLSLSPSLPPPLARSYAFGFAPCSLYPPRCFP